MKKESILQANTALGIEFGSTRIKAVLIENLLRKAVMNGKTALKIISGHIVWKIL